jgi:hypothetical protein
MKRVCRQITVGDFFKGLTLWEAGEEGDELEVFPTLKLLPEHWRAW